jgi:acetyltransferase-like isoleucine patch superfamily enzyme
MNLKDIVKQIIHYYYSLKLEHIGNNSYIHPYANISGNTKRIYLGDDVKIQAYVKLLCDSRIHIGNNTHIHENCMLITCGGNIEIGDYCYINPSTILYGHGGLKIGNNVLVAAQTIVIPANHIFTNKNQLIRLQGDTKQGIVIEDDVWIGCGCKILDGVTIGKGSVIGAGSVVTKDVEQYSVVVGVPAKVIKQR